MPSAPSPELAPLADVLAQGGVAGAVAALYGEGAIPAPGVVHVASAWDGPRGRRTIRITATSPKSAWDFFVLGATRARADAIVVTGAILRAEPHLAYALGPELAAYRASLGKTEPPELWVLTSGTGFDPAHPALRGDARPVIVAPAGARIAGAERFARRALPDGGLRALLAEARAERPDATIAIEAGPSTTRALYDEPARVDELLLSVFEGWLAPELEGGPLPDDAALEAALGPARSARAAREASGRWRFVRHRRDAHLGGSEPAS